MKKTYLIIILALANSIVLTSHQKPYHPSDAPLIAELNRLAAEIDMEFVYGDKFPMVNFYGSYGSPVVCDFLLPSEISPIKENVVFLCRKKYYTKKNM